jgi:hypothetical protein
MNSKNKICKVCKTIKPIVDFYKHKQMLGGRLNICKKCHNLNAKINRLKNLERHREYDRKRRTSKKRILQKKSYYQSEKGKTLAAKFRKLYRKNNPDKTKAHWTVSNAIRSGKITKKPCHACGKRQAHAHHDDYSRPLDVVWLCPKHHFERHKSLNQTAPSSV